MNRGFAPKPKFDPEQDFLKTFKELTYRHHGWDIWSDFIVMAACTLSNPVDKTHYEERDARCLHIIKKYNKDEQRKFSELFAHTVMALELEPEQDFLGKCILRSASMIKNITRYLRHIISANLWQR